MRSGRREPELVGGRGRLGRMSGRDDVWQTIEQFTDTFRRRDDHHQRRAVVACDHRHLRTRSSPCARRSKASARAR